MIYPSMKLEAWCEMTRLRVEEYQCPCCGQTFKTDVPVMTKDSFGLQSPIHECGNGYWTAVMRPRTADAKMFWDTII